MLMLRLALALLAGLMALPLQARLSSRPRTSATRGIQPGTPKARPVQKRSVQGSTQRRYFYAYRHRSYHYTRR